MTQQAIIFCQIIQKKSIFKDGFTNLRNFPRQDYNQKLVFNFIIKIFSKMASIQHTPTGKSFSKKLYCPEHGNKFAFRCGYQHCEKPFLCSASTCLEGHFHYQNEEKLVLFKFDVTDCAKKLQQLDRVLNKEDFSSEAKVLKSFIDELKSSMVLIYKDYRDLHNKRESLVADLSKPFDNMVMGKVEEAINIGHSLRKTIDLLKSKINLNLSDSQSGHKEDTIAIHENGNLRVPKNQLIQLQNQNKRISDKGQKQYEQGEFIIEKGEKAPHGQSIAIDLQSENKVETHKSNSPPLEQISPPESQEKYIPPFQRPQTKDSFQQLFENGSKTFSAEKVSSLRNFLQSGRKSQVHQNPKLTAHQIFSSKPQSATKQNLKIYERDFFMKKQLTIFLEQRIKNFSWGLCEEIHSSALPFKSIEKFHELLEGRRNLLFIFVGEDRILGSYYPSRYPKLVEKIRNDPNSFLFISNSTSSSDSQILQFKAVPSEFHLSVSDRLYICHGNQPSYADGIRTIQRNFSELNYCLPSVSFKSPDDEKNYSKFGPQMDKKCLSGFIKVKEFFVLQVASAQEQDNVYQID